MYVQLNASAILTRNSSIFHICPSLMNFLHCHIVPYYSGGFYENDKRRLANIMAYGEDLPKPDLKKAVAKARPPSPPAVDRFDECMF